MNDATPVTEAELKDMFEANFERLRAENGHSLSPDGKEAAWQQVRLYWSRLRHIAEAVTDTEVCLNLPNQRTPKGRAFCIEGVVDIVREDDRVTMYDIKTHDLSFVRNNLDFYADQINVYAHIWQNLRGQKLDEAAVIATPPPEDVLAAIRSGDSVRAEKACQDWDPVVPIPVDAGKVEQTVGQFARTVDAIEDHEFGPPGLDALEQQTPEGRTFYHRVCRNCDVRLSCTDYRLYARKHRDRNWRKISVFYDAPIEEGEEQDRIDAALPAVDSAIGASGDL